VPIPILTSRQATLRIHEPARLLKRSLTCLGKAALKPRALQTLRDCRAPPNRAKRLECVRFIGAFRPAHGDKRFMVSRHVRKRIRALREPHEFCVRAPFESGGGRCTPGRWRVGQGHPNFRQVLECAAPAALWNYLGGSWSQCVRENAAVQDAVARSAGSWSECTASTVVAGRGIPAAISSHPAATLPIRPA